MKVLPGAFILFGYFLQTQGYRAPPLPLPAQAAPPAPVPAGNYDYSYNYEYPEYEDKADEEPVPPQFQATDLNVRVEMGKVATLACKVGNLDGGIIMWKKKETSELLAVGEKIISRSHLQVDMERGDTSLLKIYVRDQTDAGEYVCEVSAYPAPIEQTFRVEIVGHVRPTFARDVQLVRARSEPNEVLKAADPISLLDLALFFFSI